MQPSGMRKDSGRAKGCCSLVQALAAVRLQGILACPWRKQVTAVQGRVMIAFARGHLLWAPKGERRPTIITLAPVRASSAFKKAGETGLLQRSTHRHGVLAPPPYGSNRSHCDT